MISMSVKKTVTERDHGEKRIISELHKFGKETAITTGIHAREGRAVPYIKGKLTRTPVSQYAFFMEYGTRNKRTNEWHAPPRPFMTLSFNASKDSMHTMAKHGLGLMYTGVTTLDKRLDFMGHYQKEFIKETIRILNYPPNKPSTIAGKKRYMGTRAVLTPLIFTGTMHNAVTYRIVRPKRRNAIKRSIDSINKRIRKAVLWQ